MWINVNDILPKDDEWVLVATKETNTCAAGVFYGMRRGIVWYDSMARPAPTDGITHWMPMPAPPNSENVEQNDSGGVEAKPDSQQLKPKMPLLNEVYIGIQQGLFSSLSYRERHVLEACYEFISRHFGR